ncbi:MAG: hypothetical protein R3C53_25075 [Pirellulaceae bacterium]
MKCSDESFLSRIIREVRIVNAAQCGGTCQLFVSFDQYGVLLAIAREYLFDGFGVALQNGSLFSKWSQVMINVALQLKFTVNWFLRHGNGRNLQLGSIDERTLR